MTTVLRWGIKHPRGTDANLTTCFEYAHPGLVDIPGSSASRTAPAVYTGVERTSSA
jgi:hypothetical protein